MKEATGETSMTVITIAAIAVIGAIVAALWPTIKEYINNSWGGIYQGIDDNADYDFKH